MSTPRPYKRCPSCGSRVAETSPVCDICGHEFGTTQAIPRSALESARAQATGGERPIKPPPRPLRTTPAGSRPRNASWLARLPWGVIGVVAVIVLIAIIAWAMLQRDGITEAAVEPTIEVILNEATDAAESAILAADRFPDTPTPTLSPPTNTPAPTPTPPPPVQYSVKAGDTCGGIAERFGVTLTELTAANQLDPVTCLIRIGDILTIPVATPTQSPAATTDPSITAAPSPVPNAGPTATLPPQVVYVVKGGDTCSEIAQKFNVSVELLMQQNNLDTNCLIRLNQVLTLTFATPTPIVSPTPFVLQTPTPRTGYSAPILTTPLNRTEISATQEFVTLQWLTVGLLQPDEWYVVQVQPSNAITVPIFETKATSLKVTQALLGDDNTSTINWWVQVKRFVRVDPTTGQRVYIELSPPSAVRSFVWSKRPDATPQSPGP